jgi:hypothetical protein
VRSWAASRPTTLNVLLCLVFAALGAVLPSVAARWARPAIIEFGPNDVRYTAGFREDWERDGLTRFRWTGTHATVTVPVGVSGDGARVRARLRRHLVDPAEVSLFAFDRMVGRFDIQADLRAPYRTIDLALPPSLPPDPLILTIQSTSANPRPLGVALDWLEVVRGEGRFVITTAHALRLAAFVAAAFALPLLAGAPRAWCVVHAALALGAVLAGTAWDVVASERIAAEGAAVYVVTGALALGVARWSRLRAALLVDSPAVAGALVLTTLCALALRLVLMLHPQFYYPDVKVHALFAWQLARHGLVRFLEEFTANQYRFSLGLQLENGHWYAFPYPPVFYILSWPLVRLARFRPEVAVSIVAAVVNSLEAWLVFGIARRLRCATATALAAAAALVVLPIFTARLTLAYFPALVGHAVDAVVLVVILAGLRDLDRAKVIARVGLLVAVALLTYTQSLLNVAVLVPLIVVATLAIEGGPGARRRMAGLVAAAALGGVLALAIFYGRYVPIFLDMRSGIPMAEEQILLEKQAQERAATADAPAIVEQDDPYTGPEFSALRGVRKAGWRMYVFYGLFAPVIALGIVILVRMQDPAASAFVAAWALSYLVLNLASGSLPGPNLVRYNKDLEIVAPLFCVALAVVGEEVWLRSRASAWAFALAYVAFAGVRAAGYLTTKFVLER